MTRPRPRSALIDEVTPALFAYATTMARTFGQERDELLQIALEQAVRLEPQFDPSRGVKFLTFIWRAMAGAIVRFGLKNTLGLDAADVDALIGAAADHVESVARPVDVLHDSEDQLIERARETRNGAAAAMALEVASTGQGRAGAPGGDPETALRRAQERARLRRVLEAAIATLPAADQLIVRRHGLGGEDLKAVLADVPAWRGRDYRRGWEHYGRLIRKIGEEMWLSGGMAPESVGEVVAVGE